MNRLWIWGWLGAMLLAQPALADRDPEALARQ